MCFSFFIQKNIFCIQKETKLKVDTIVFLRKEESIHGFSWMAITL